MDEQTGTEEAIFEASDVEQIDSIEEQAEEIDGSAVEETNELSESEEQAEEAPAVESSTQTSDEISAFLAKKGIDPSDPNSVRKIAEMYRNSEKGFYSKSQEVAQLQRTLSQQNQQQSLPDQEALNEVRSMRIEMDTKDWKASHNLSAEDEQKMYNYITSPLVDRQGQPVMNPYTGQPYTKGILVNNGHLSLDEVYKLAGCGVKEVGDLKENLRKEIQAEMAARQAAKRPNASSTNSMQFGQAETEDPFLTGLFG